ncbi:hypothetical protein [Mesorhizobium sp. 1M-11]|uniref:hypothetical protein n=1 Tax=Mesorhizobium sp. 1M-11 TaxID=1529006 RepID=UPI001FCD222B|nr:hypothetical protein [Mesorhizobium sp. 1M-11]
MAKAPSAFDDSGHGKAGSPSPADHAMRATTIVLTASAERYVRDHDLATALDLLRLPEGCANGDLVSLEAGKGVRHDFSIIRRRWVAAANSTELEITLDYPAASPRR